MLGLGFGLESGFGFRVSKLGLGTVGDKIEIVIEVDRGRGRDVETVVINTRQNVVPRDQIIPRALELGLGWIKTWARVRVSVIVRVTVRVGGLIELMFQLG